MIPSSLELIVNDALGVVAALAPLVALFLAFQMLVLRLPAAEVLRVLSGTAIAAAGLFLFLAGVNLAFLPFGRLIGEAIGMLSNPWAVLALGTLLGFVTPWGEPSVHILADEIEAASGGRLGGTVVVVAICAGVAIAVGIGLLRIAYDVPIVWLLIPGYALAIVAMRYTQAPFVAIAADAGGVATGPSANSFLLALALGASEAQGGRDLLVNGFGLVALIALAPILSVMVLGMIVQRRSRTWRTPS